MLDWKSPEIRRLLEQLLTASGRRGDIDPLEDVFAIESANVAWPRIRDCLLDTSRTGDESHCLNMIRQLAATDTPLMLFSHQFDVLRNLVLARTLDEGVIDTARQTMQLFDAMEESFAAAYLAVFLNRLGTRNHLRLSHIRALNDKNLLVYFEAHLEWMARLVEAVGQRCSSAMPELDPTQCRFGSWLEEDGPRLIRDRSHIAHIRKLHAAMHHVVSEVSGIMNHPRASGPVYALLKKAESYSLELGHEISLLNSIVIMSVYSKDALTGFLSRRFLDRVLLNQMEIAKATESPFSIIMFDLDHFKQLNDHYGHQTGDLALEHVADIVRETLRQSDLIFRYGGEEFMLVSPSTTLTQAQAIAEKLRQRIASCLLPHDPPIALTASFGVSEIAPGTYEVVDKHLVHDVIAACDGRLYAAKNSGRNRVL